MRLRQLTPGGDALRGGLADVADLGHLLDRRSQQRIKRAEVVAQDAARLLADMPNAEREQQPRQVAGLARFNRADKIVRPDVHLFAERQQLLDRQVVQVSRRLDQSGVDQLLQVALAAAVDVHRVTRREMHQVSQKLRRTRGTRAADSRLVLIVVHRRAAHRTELRELIRHGIQRTPVLFHADDLRNDFSGFSDGNNVAHAGIELTDKIAVMQRCAGHRGARKPYRLEHGIRCQHAGASHRDDDILEKRLLDLGRVLVRRRPPREFRGRAERFTLCEGVDLDNSTVNVEIQLTAGLTHVLNLALHVLRVGVDRIARTCRKTEALQIVKRLHMAFHRQLVAVLNVEAKDGQPALTRNPAVLLPQRAGSRVARIGKERLVMQLELGVECVEHGLFHVDLTAHNEMRRCVLQLFRDVLDGFEVLGYILAHLTVTACRTADEHTVHIFERDRKAVDLVLDNVLRLSDGILHTGIELAEFVKRENILQAFEWVGVRHLGKPAARRAADPLGRRVRVCHLRMLGLERAKLTLQHVVLIVGDLGRVLVIVFFVVIPQLLPQSGNLLTHVHNKTPLV